MPRIKRFVVPGLPHHVTQRGNNKRTIFYDNDDRLQYLEWFREYSVKYGLTVIGYCLMDNHVHFLVIPREKDSLESIFRILHMRYSRYQNRKIEINGHLWQGRFFSCVIDSSYFLTVMKYIERNPVRANLCREPWDWEWSSAADHIGERLPYFSVSTFNDFVEMPHYHWKQFISSAEKVDSVYEIRKCTLSGQPLFVESKINELKKEYNLNRLAG